MAILSQRPFAKTASVSELINWNFKEELPQLITKTFIEISPFLSFIFKACPRHLLVLDRLYMHWSLYYANAAVIMAIE